MKRTILVSLTLAWAVIAVLSVVTTASAVPSPAQQPVVSISMSATPGGPEQTHFPSGTGAVYVTMTYTNASQTRIEVHVFDDMGIPILWGPEFKAYLPNVFKLYRPAAGESGALDLESRGPGGRHVQQGRTRSPLRRYRSPLRPQPYVEYIKTGNGSEMISITGDRVFQAYFKAAAWYGSEMQQNVNDALDKLDEGRPIHEVRGDVGAAITAGNQFMNPLTRLRDDYQTSTGVSGHVSGAISSLGQALDEGAAAVDPNLGDPTELRAHLEQMKAFTDQAVAHTAQAQIATAGSGVSYALIDTRPCVDGVVQENTTTTAMDGLPSSSIGWTVRDKGAAARIDMVARPSRIYASSVTVAGAVHSTSVEATVSDAACIPVNATVAFSTVPADNTRGTVTPTSAATVNGVATTTLTAGLDEGDGALGVRAEVGNVTGVVTVTVIGPPANVIFRNISRYIGIGGTQTPVQVDVTDSNAHEVADGTGVIFSLDPSAMGGWDAASVTTISGAASATLLSGDTTGPATIIATADTVVSNTYSVTFVGPPATVQVTPNPEFAPIIGESASSEISVEVWDAEGWKAADGTLITFSVEPTGIAEFSPSNEATLRDGSTSRTLQLLPPELLPPGIQFPAEVTVTVTAGDALGQARVVFTEGAGLR